MKLRTQIFLGYFLILAFLVVFAGITYTSLASLTKTASWVSHTHKAISMVTNVEKLIIDMETGERGFLITGKEEFLEPYNSGQMAHEELIDDLMKHVSDNPKNVKLLEEIHALVNKWLEVAALPEIEARRRMNRKEISMEEVSAIIEKGIGKSIIDSLRQKINAFIETEKELLDARDKESKRATKSSINIIFIMTLVAIVIGVLAMLYVTRKVLTLVGGEPAVIAQTTDRIAQGKLDIEFEGKSEATTGIMASVITMVQSLRSVVDLAENVSKGNYDTAIPIRGEDDRMGMALKKMTDNLRQASKEDARNSWFNKGQTELADRMRGDQDLDEMLRQVVTFVAKYVEAQVGAIFMADTERCLRMVSSYAYKKRKKLSNEFRPGEGLIGQAALEKETILLTKVPEDYIEVSSGLGNSPPRNILVMPLIYGDEVKAVIELGSVIEFPEETIELLEQMSERVAIAIHAAQARMELKTALEKSQALSEELQSQQEELRTANEELEEQTQALQQSEERLQVQQEELQVTNEELEEKNEALNIQKREMELAKTDIEEKAEELAIASKYKSEFLANMSHELRTPLNSLLLLARSLSDNEEGNLSNEQVESAGVIYSSGNDLLVLINEILDLSKIEAGQMDIHIERVSLQDIADSIRSNFQHMADVKGLELGIIVNDNAPGEIFTDRKRIEQIIRNLISNALKFTQQGGITVDFSRPASDARMSRSGLDTEKAFAIAIKDSGIGIPQDKQQVIFEAFQQASGGTAREFGGTGLGLSISRVLAQLLGGEIQLTSREGQGSTFTLYLPIETEGETRKAERGSRRTPRYKQNVPASKLQIPSPEINGIPDDRDSIEKGDKILLVIEDDPKFAKILLKHCYEKGYKCLASATGEEGLDLAERYAPEGIILDIQLPGIDGWTVLETLKDNPKTRHIPVHIVSVESSTIDARQKGAIGFQSKPVSREQLDMALNMLEETFSKELKELLVVEDDENLRKGIIRLVGDGDVHANEASTGKAAIQALKDKDYDCMILDLGLPDMTGFDLLKTADKAEDIKLPPVVVYTGKELTHAEEMELRSYSESIIVKGVKSEERLLDEVSLFLHRMVADMSEKKRKIITDLHDADKMFIDKKILIVDDDMRNVFALSKVLKERGMTPLKAEDGQKALELLAKESDIGLVLMDIMMPVMDGYETMKRIRAQETFKTLPIIALTAKAMKEDRERCLAAGANDYMPKPVDVNRLFSMMRVWLYR